MAPFTGIGTQLQRGNDASPQVFVAIVGVTSINLNKGTKAQIEVTDLANTSGYADYIGGLKEGGTVEAVANYSADDDTLASVEDDFDGTGDPRAWRIYFPQSDSSPVATYEFLAYVEEYSFPAIQPKDAVKVNFKLKISGPVERV